MLCFMYSGSCDVLVIYLWAQSWSDIVWRTSLRSVLYLIHTVYITLDPPGPIDNSNILFVKGNTKVLRASKYIAQFFPNKYG